MLKFFEIKVNNNFFKAFLKFFFLKIRLFRYLIKRFFAVKLTNF
jgi:hypothetical protein